MNSRDEALVTLGRWLTERQYRFTTPTPETHRRVNGRAANAEARTLQDVFGWSRPFARETVPSDVFALLDRSGQLSTLDDGRYKSGVRYSTLNDQLYVHSAFPTESQDCVFFGPDTYRYVRLLRDMPGRFGRAVDVGAGSGAGLLSIARRCQTLHFTDVNPLALRYTRVNAAINGAQVNVVQTDVLRGVQGAFDLIVSNPPYLVDEGERAYRHGGDRGIELPARIVEESLQLLSRKGTLVVYTGTPIVAGRDLFLERVRPLFDRFDGTLHYEELDPDVFGEELDQPAYADVDRIAVVSLRATRGSP